MLKGGDTGPAIAPGKPAESLLIEAINYGGTYQMPPDGKLKADEIAALTQWVKIGAPWPDGEGPSATKGKHEFNLAERMKHWSFQSIRRYEPPAVKDAAWPRCDIDRFILAKLDAAGLRPAPEADRATLIRRLYFDLTGLPPTPQQVTQFVSDKSAGAYSKWVDQLLDSPQYGERWGQHWLDVVRFAETDGFEYDTHRKDAWRYRDYVIRAFQNDKPYDRFLTEQLAGDEISRQEDEPLIAAGFNRLGPLRKNAGNQEVASSRNEVLTEMTNVIGSALLGVTLGCARCHDHKFDPIRQSDYYRIQSYFAAAQQKDISRATPEQEAAWKAKAEPIEAELKRLKASMRGKSPDQKEAIQKKLEELQEGMPDPPPAVQSVTDDLEHKSPIHLLARGDYQNKGDAVGMRPLGVLLPDGAPEVPKDVKEPRAELDSLQRRVLETPFVVRAGREEGAAPDCGTRRSNVRGGAGSPTLAEPEKKIPILRYEVTGRGRRCMQRSHGAKLGMFGKKTEDLRKSVGLHRHIGVDKEQDLALRDVGTTVSGVRGTRSPPCEANDGISVARGELRRPIATRVIDYDQLVTVSRQIAREYCGQRTSQRGGAIAHRNNDGQGARISHLRDQLVSESSVFALDSRRSAPLTRVDVPIAAIVLLRFRVLISGPDFGRGGPLKPR